MQRETDDIAPGRFDVTVTAQFTIEPRTRRTLVVRTADVGTQEYAAEILPWPLATGVEQQQRGRDDRRVGQRGGLRTVKRRIGLTVLHAVEGAHKVSAAQGIDTATPCHRHADGGRRVRGFFRMRPLHRGADLHLRVIERARRDGRGNTVAVFESHHAAGWTTLRQSLQQRRHAGEPEQPERRDCRQDWGFDLHEFRREARMPDRVELPATPVEPLAPAQECADLRTRAESVELCRGQFPEHTGRGRIGGEPCECSPR